LLKSVADNNNEKAKRNHVLSVSLIMILLVVAVSTAQLSSMVVSNDGVLNVYAKYSNNQAQSLVNDCDVFSSGGAPNCQNNAPQTTADGTAPISIQKSNPGQPGPQGPAGPQGPPGPDKILSTREVFNTTESGGPGIISAEADCADDEEVTGGGYLVSPQNAVLDLIVNGNSRSNNGWIVQIFSEVDNVDLTAFAECAKLVDAP
jgi:hypothetical protein